MFNAAFYGQLDGVLLALDNVEARRYMDHVCWLHRRPMLDSGTLGTSGSVQPILPGLTERYPQEQVASDRPLAMCTLRRFPTTIHHTLQWARSVEEGYGDVKCSGRVEGGCEVRWGRVVEPSSPGGGHGPLSHIIQSVCKIFDSFRR